MGSEKGAHLCCRYVFNLKMRDKSSSMNNINQANKIKASSR